MWSNVKFVPVDGANPILPEYKTKYAACADISAHFHSGLVTSYTRKNSKIVQSVTDNIVIQNNDRVLIPTGWRPIIPMGYHVSINPRSGLALKNGLIVINSPGTIDGDYTDEIFILVSNISDIPILIEEGDRIAQIEIVKNRTIETYFSVGTEKELLAHKNLSNRSGGFGHTGVHITDRDNQ
jgi:dUTP pyrophosphatase